MRLSVLLKKSTNYFILFVSLFLSLNVFSQNITITDDDNYTAYESAMLDIKSTTKGLLIPRVTSGERALISPLTQGLLVFDTEESAFYYYDGSEWVNMSKGQIWNVNSNYVLLSDSTAKVGIGTYTPNSKLEVRADNSFTDTDTLFAVKDKKGNIVFAVFPDGAKVYINETSKGKVGGFAISGRSPNKAEEEDYLKVTPDSTRIWVNEPLTKGKVGGFAISGRSPNKEITKEYFIANQDSTRIYIDTTSVKGKVGGFAISGRSPNKVVVGNIMEVTLDSTRIYVTENAAKGKVGGFAISGRSPNKGVTGDYFNVSGNTSADVVNNERRMMWYPQKAALLAGEVHVGSADSVGTNSTAIGYRNISMGEYSQAFGYKSHSLGKNSSAIGNSALALANNSFAFGDSAVARGVGSYAFGSTGLDTTSGTPTNVQTIANGDYSFAFGFGSYAGKVGSYAMGVNSESTGEYAFAIGASNQANKKGSYAIGNLCIADGKGAFAIGYESTASAISSFAIGFSSSADSIGAFAIGNWNTASGESALAMGTNTTASGGYSSSFGISTIASGRFSTSLGNTTIASGGSSIAMGWLSEAAGKRAVAGGHDTYASGDNSVAFGDGSQATGITSTAFGNLTQATNTFATSFGASTIASGHTSTAMGNTVTVSGYSSFGIGLDATSYTIAQDNTFAVLGGKVGINTVSPDYAMDIAGYLNIAKGAIGTGAIVFRVDGDEALWYNGSVFSWGAGATSHNYFQDNVSIGVSTSTYPLSVAGTANLNSGISTGTALRVDGAATIYKTGSTFYWGSGGSYNYFPDEVGIGTTDTEAGILNVAGSAPVVRIKHNSSSGGQAIRFANNLGNMGNIYITTTGVNYNGFTGSHFAKVEDDIKLGQLVSLTGTNTYVNKKDNSEIIYGGKLSIEPNSKDILGVYLENIELDENKRCDLVMAVGNGIMWVADNGENLEIGDYLISSSVPGHAMKDLGEFETSNIVGRVAEPVYWENETEMINGVKHKLISVFYENFTIRNSNTELENKIQSLIQTNNDLIKRIESIEEKLK